MIKATSCLSCTADKGWWNVRCHACEESSKVFLSGHSSRNKPREIIVPLSVESSLTPVDMNRYTTIKWLSDYDTQG